MNLTMPYKLADLYQSPSQRARIITEAWAANEIYCPSCLNPSLAATPVNFKVIDYICNTCLSSYQLKSTKTGIGKTIPDGAYHTMINAIREDQAPNLLLLHYHFPAWEVRNLVVISGFVFSEQAIIPRKALSLTARRAGWIGCNIDLSRIAPETRIPVVLNGVVLSHSEVSEKYLKLKSLAEVKPLDRGWTLAVLNVIQSRGWKEFATRDIYEFELQFGKMFPMNKNIRPKLRQQLQILRDLGFLIHPEKGIWKPIQC